MACVLEHRYVVVFGLVLGLVVGGGVWRESMTNCRNKGFYTGTSHCAREAWAMAFVFGVGCTVLSFFLWMSATPWAHTRDLRSRMPAPRPWLEKLASDLPTNGTSRQTPVLPPPTGAMPGPTPTAPALYGEDAPGAIPGAVPEGGAEGVTDDCKDLSWPSEHGEQVVVAKAIDYAYDPTDKTPLASAFQDCCDDQRNLTYVHQTATDLLKVAPHVDPANVAQWRSMAAEAKTKLEHVDRVLRIIRDHPKFMQQQTYKEALASQRALQHQVASAESLMAGVATAAAFGAIASATASSSARRYR